MNPNSVEHVLDVWVAPQIDVDQISQRLKSQVCPVYISPNLVAGVYAVDQPMFGHWVCCSSRIKARRFSCPVSDGISHNARWLSTVSPPIAQRSPNRSRDSAVALAKRSLKRCQTVGNAVVCPPKA
uniref:Uncharacterized protein n=1 Tax=Ditylenchus dipsaci TaxID=166011 RepID=A0A915EH62_9BILA